MKKAFLNGIFKENPIFVLFLGMCSTLAVTTSAFNAVGMGLSTMIVLIFSNMFISMLRRFIPDKVRIAAYVVVIAGFVTIVQMLIEAYAPAVSAALGIYIPLIVVNCIILGRAEAFASKNSVLLSAADGAGMGLGFTLALLIIGSVREILGVGTFFGIQLFGAWYKPISIMILPPGAFLTLALIVMVINLASAGKKKNKEEK